MNKSLKLKRYNLSPNKSLSYIQSRLKTGNTLSQMINIRINFMNGNIYTYLPEYIYEKDVYNFEEGVYKIDKEKDQQIEYRTEDNIIGAIHIKQTIANSAYWLANEIIKDFTNKESNEVIFEDPIRSIKTLKYHSIENAIIYHDELYILIEKEITLERMTNIISAIPNFQPPLKGFLYYKNKSDSLRDLKLTREYFATIANNISKIIIGAYDSEGYIIWEKNNTKV